jgi:hypothetical protein
MRPSILGLALLLWSGGQALAQTAPATAASEPVAGSPSVADQIDAFIKAAPVPDVTRDATPGVTSSSEPADRKIHGVVEVGVGSGGYRHAYGRADMPLGDSGRLSIAVDETRFNSRFGRGRLIGGPLTSQSLDIGASWGAGALRDPCRSRYGGDIAEAPYAAPASGGPDGCRTIERTGP